MQVQECRWLAGGRFPMTQIWRELEFKAEIYSRNKTLVGGGGTLLISLRKRHTWQDSAIEELSCQGLE